MEFEFEVRTKVQRPVQEVFDAVHNPTKLSAYFTTAGASGPLDEGKTVYWDFADFPGKFPVFVKKVVPNELIELEWAAAPDKDTPSGYNTAVRMTFAPIDSDSTLVAISESGWKETQTGLKSSYGNCQGWSQMVFCLKAFLEYGINLRKGAY